jgi:hypothetical protein
MASIATLGHEVHVHWVSHPEFDGLPESFAPMLAGFLPLRDAWTTVIVMDSDPILGGPMARFARNTSDRLEPILNVVMVHGVMALDAIGIRFEILNPKLRSDLLRFGLTMQRDEGLMVRSSLPRLDLHAVAFLARLGAEYFMGIDCNFPMLVPNIARLLRHPNHSGTDRNTDESDHTADTASQGTMKIRHTR